MKDWRSLAHTKWDCKYHMVLIPKYRHKVFFAKSRKRVGEILRELCRYKGIIFVNKKRWIETNKVSSISELMMNFKLT